MILSYCTILVFLLYSLITDNSLFVSLKFCFFAYRYKQLVEDRNSKPNAQGSFLNFSSNVFLSNLIFTDNLL